MPTPSDLNLSLTRTAALPEPSFVQLGVFNATMITGSVSRAAKLLGITQPAASKMLRQLEAETGLLLFERSSQKLSPTPEALRLHQTVELLYGNYGAVQRVIGSLKSPDHGNVTVAAIPTQATTFLPAAVNRLRQHYPQITVTVETLANGPVIDRVQSGQADFGLVHNVSPSPHTINEDIGSQHLVCLSHIGHHFSSMPHVTAQHLKGGTFVSYGPDTNFGNFLEEAFSCHGVRMGVDVIVTSSATLIAMISAGVGVGLVEPAALINCPTDRLNVTPFRPTLEIHSRIVRSRIRPLTRHAELLLDAYREVVRSADASLLRM